MASALVILIILIFAAYYFQKGGLIKSFGTLIVTLAASIISFAYFELLANLLIPKLPESLLTLAPWMHTLSFVLLFALSFAVLQTILNQLLREKIEFEKKLERIVSIICGILIGFIISGVVLIALAMAPLPPKYPYQRFDNNRPDPQRPKKVLLNPDGFISWLFSHISSGSFSAINKNISFASMHPHYIDQLFLNRQGVPDKIQIVSIGNEIVLPAKNAAWFAPEDLKDSESNPVAPKTASNFIIVRTGIKRLNIKTKCQFITSQLRLICKPKDSGKHFTGKAAGIHPIGYLKTDDTIQKIRLTDIIELTRDDLSDQLPGGFGKWIDFVFEVPEDLTTAMIEFRQNSIARVPEPVTADKVSLTSFFIPASESAKDFAEIEPVSSAQIYGISMTAQLRLLEELSITIESETEFAKYQTENSIEQPRFKDSKIEYVRAELQTPTRKEKQTALYPARSLKGLASILKPLEGYKLLSLKCNNPAVGSEIAGSQLPVLKEFSGRIHKPVGVIACGELSNEFIYEIDFCAVTAERRPDGLVIAQDGTVEKPFPDSIWITEKAEEILEFYVLYLVKPGPDVFINSVQPADTKTAGGFKEYEGFIVK